MPDLSHWEWFVAVAVGVISVGRMARLLTFDDFPPAKWVRVQYTARVPEKWSGLMECPFCLCPYLMAVQMIWFGLLVDTDHFWWFWLVPNLWWALSYLAAMTVAWDQPPDD